MNSVRATALAGKLVEVTKLIAEGRHDDAVNTLLAISERLRAVEVCLFGEIDTRLPSND
jgi:hypothetical protein